MSQPVPPIELRECRYVIVFRASQATIDSFEHGRRAVVEMDKVQCDGGTFPLGLDRAYIPLLPALWYCLHLPRSRYDLLRKPVARLKFLQHLYRPQDILVVPAQFPERNYELLTDSRPTLVFAEDNIPHETLQLLVTALGNVIATTRISSLSDETLVTHWKDLQHAFAIKSPAFPTQLRLMLNTHLRPTWLPAYFVAGELYPDKETQLQSDLQSVDQVLRISLEHHARIAAYFRLVNIKNKELPDDIELKEALNFDRKHFSCPVVLGVPGISSSSPTSLISKSWTDAEMKHHGNDNEIENSAIDFMVAHRALGRNGVALIAQEMSIEAFALLGQLESHWNSGKPKPRYVWRVLRRIGEIFNNCLTNEQNIALGHANDITCFSEFPIGIGIPPGKQSPLTCGIPITYRPLAPLTRAIALECNYLPSVYLRNKLNVLILECLASDDPVGQISRVGWKVAIEACSDVPTIDIHTEEISSIGEFIAAILKRPYDILVISAHGGKSKGGNRTGLICGKDIILGDELPQLPPIVCLSACQVSPRGHGTVNVSDLLLRQGAQVVIGTLIPIDVRHNSTIMTRFFANIAATMNGTETRFRTLQDIWHFVVTYNAFNDVIWSNESIHSWIDSNERRNGKSVLQEFMTNRNGRLEPGSIYEDTIARLEQIAADHGIQDKFRSWISSQGFIPESIFYVMMGAPERFIFNDPIIAKIAASETGSE